MSNDEEAKNNIRINLKVLQDYDSHLAHTISHGHFEMLEAM